MMVAQFNLNARDGFLLRESHTVAMQDFWQAPLTQEGLAFVDGRD